MTAELQTSLNTEIDTLLTTIKTEQMNYVIDHGKYIQKAEVDTGTLKYEVHEYVAPTGIGFTCIFRASEAGKDYIKTVGLGVGNGSHDWQELTHDEI